jgi:hypothetical protein
VFSVVGEWGMSVFDAVFVGVGFEIGVAIGVGSPYGRVMSMYCHVHVSTNTDIHAV